MKIKRIIGAITAISFLFLPVALEAMTSKTGATAANFLKLGVGARAAAMGEAFSAVSDDVTAIYWNPAGLAQLQKDELAAMYKDWFVDINSGFLAYAHPSGKSTLAGAINYVDAGEIRQTSQAGPDGVIFRPEDFAISLSHAQYLRGDFAVGSTVKYIHQKLHNENANGIAFDAGFLYRPHKFLYLSGVFQNLGTKMKFVKEGFELPLTFKLGGAYRLKGLTFAVDYNKPIDNKPSINLGLESKIGPVIDLRLGYRYETSDNKLDLYKSSSVGLSGGFGLNLGGTYYLDYAFASYGDLGDTQRVAFLMKVGAPGMPPAPIAPPVVLEVPEELEVPPKEVKPEKVVVPPPPAKPPEVKPEEAWPEVKPEVKPEVWPEVKPEVKPEKVGPPKPEPPIPMVKPEVQPEEPPEKVKPAERISPPKERVPKTQEIKITPIIRPGLKLKEFKIQPAEKIEPKQQIMVLVDETAIWAGPGATYTQIATVKKGDTLILLDDSKKFYLKILLPDGTTGWICYVFVSK